MGAILASALAGAPEEAAAAKDCVEAETAIFEAVASAVEVDVAFSFLTLELLASLVDRDLAKSFFFTAFFEATATE